MLHLVQGLGDFFKGSFYPQAGKGQGAELCMLLRKSLKELALRLKSLQNLISKPLADGDARLRRGLGFRVYGQLDLHTVTGLAKKFQPCIAQYIHVCLSMVTIGGSTGRFLGNAAVDLGLQDTDYVVAQHIFILLLL